MSTFSDGGVFHPDESHVEQRTSVLAIVALVLSLICFIPGLGAIGALLGVVALILISKSAGRLVGSGFAIAGTIIGMIVTVIWVAVLVGASSVLGVFSSSLIKPAQETMTAIESGDFAKARASFASSTISQLTDADFEAFRKEYKDSLGTFNGGPSGFWDYLSMFSTLSPAMQSKMSQLQGRNDTIPIPMKFEKGTGLLFVVIDNSGAAGRGAAGGGGPAKGFIPVINMQIISGDKTITLIDPNARALPGDAKPADGSGEKPADGATGEKPSEKPGDTKPEPK